MRDTLRNITDKEIRIIRTKTKSDADVLNLEYVLLSLFLK